MPIGIGSSLKSACPLPFQVRGNACACVPLLFSGIRQPTLLPEVYPDLSGLPSSAHYCTTLAFGYPSAPSAWVWTLPDICVTMPDITI
ncbi:hypothetical protein ACFLZG_03730 [Thermodesulfobacteriota bacterium]